MACLLLAAACDVELQGLGYPNHFVSSLRAGFRALMFRVCVRVLGFRTCLLLAAACDVDLPESSVSSLRASCWLSSCSASDLPSNAGTASAAMLMFPWLAGASLYI